MIDFASEKDRDRLREALNRDEAFATETRWFDGSILLEADDTTCWLKIYRGRVLEALGAAPPFGYTFKLRGARDSWQELVDRPSRLADLVTPGQRRFANDPALKTADRAARPRLALEGNLLEAGRMHEALFQLAECLAALAAGK